MTRSGAPWAPPITSAREARLIIETVWMPAVQSYDFPVYPRDAAQREMGKENRRKILLPLGEMGIERGSINVAADVRAVARRTGISHNTVAKHLKAEARAKRFIKLKVPGERNAAGGFATIYMLLVDRLRRDGGDDRRGYTTQASQTLNKHIQAEPSKAPPPMHNLLPLDLHQVGNLRLPILSKKALPSHWLAQAVRRRRTIQSPMHDGGPSGPPVCV
jgi:DNA-binding transcriptional ArsR family regulator